MTVTRTSSLPAVAWVSVGVLVAVALAGSILGWYRQLSWFDEALHVGLGLSMTLLVGVWLRDDVLTGWSHHAGLLILALVLIGLGVGAAWEVLEFAYDHLSGPRSVIHGKFDTVVDLICDSGGAFIAAVWLVADSRA